MSRADHRSVLVALLKEHGGVTVSKAMDVGAGLKTGLDRNGLRYQLNELVKAGLAVKKEVSERVTSPMYAGRTGQRRITVSEFRLKEGVSQ